MDKETLSRRSAPASIVMIKPRATTDHEKKAIGLEVFNDARMFGRHSYIAGYHEPLYSWLTPLNGRLSIQPAYINVR